MTLFTVVSISMDFPKTSSFESNGTNSMNCCQASLVEHLNLETCFKTKSTNICTRRSSYKKQHKTFNMYDLGVPTW